MARLIVNADDFGISETVNRAILARIEAAAVTSTTVIGNGPAFSGVRELIRKSYDVSCGVHLNLTQFKPLSDNRDLAPILSEDGDFAAGKIRSVTLSRRLRRAILDEWSHQIDRVKSSGIRITHLDSHHHVHTIPGLFSVVNRVRRKHNIRAIRPTMNIYSSSWPPKSKTLPFRKLVWNTAMRYFGGALMPAYFTSFAAFIESAQRHDYTGTTIEVMVHPGSSANSAEDRMLDERHFEKLSFKVSLISYHQI
jgi:predicted glycoside hydrolase/deacetylase ChbG (UPF0249 family)